MTNDALERIWAYEHCQQVTAARSPTWFPRWAEAHVYIRADHAQAELQAAVQAEREACAGAVYEHALKNGSKIPATYNRILHRTDADAQAALEAVKREARNEALKEAAVNLKAYAPHLEDGPEHDVGYYHGYHTALNRILALMEGQSDE